MLARFAFLPALALLLVVASGCDSGGGTTDPPPPAAPTFQIASVVVPFGDGTQGLQFAAKPSADVNLVRVDVTNPLGNSIVFSPQNSIVLAGQTVQLQNPNEAYFRVSGNWSFRFVGQLAAGTQTTFDVTTPLSVSALAPDAPTE